MKKPLLIFDFDGTLVDSFQVFVDAYNTIAPVYGLTPVSADQQLSLQGNSAPAVIKKLKIRFWQLPLVVNSLKKIMKKEEKKMTLFPGVDTMLKELHDAGIMMGILSSNRVSTISSVMQRYGLISYFSFIRSEKNLYGKDRYLMYLRHKYGKNYRLYYVGDQVTDVRDARRAKVVSIAISWGFNDKKSLQAIKPEYLVDSAEEITKILVPTKE